MHWARREGVPSVLEVNAPLIDEQAEHRELIRRRVAENMTRRAMHEAKVTYAVSSEIVSYCRRFLPHTRNVAVIPNGVNTNRFSPTTSPLMPSDDFTIGFVGSLKPWHGIGELLAAFQLLQEESPDPSLRLLVVGDGPRRSDIEAFLQQHPHLESSVQLIGAVRADQVPAYLTSMDVAVAPYPRLSNFYFSPLKIFEYMAAGRAIVGSSSGQVPEILCDGENGLLYEAGNAQQLANCVQRLRDDPALRRRIGRTARQDVSHRDWHCVLNQVLELAGLLPTANRSCSTQTRKTLHEKTIA
jgi:glycosyltransferase involved in cell wall biosynthesis